MMPTRRAPARQDLSDGDGIEIGEGDVCLDEGCADDWNDGAEMLAGCKFRNNTAIAGVGGNL